MAATTLVDTVKESGATAVSGDWAYASPHTAYPASTGNEDSATRQVVPWGARMNINATAGAIEYASALVEDKTGQDLTAASFRLGLSLSRTTAPAAWESPDVTENVGTNVRIKLLIQSQPVGKYWLWAKITDTPEVIPIACTNDVITII